MAKTTMDRLMKRCIPEPNSGCWLWIGCFSPGGYGSIWMPSLGHLRRAHRVSYEEHKGTIPDGLDIMHKCDERSCINPDHLIAGTRKENMEDCVRKGRICAGENQPNSKLVSTQVLAIRSDPRPSRKVASEYSIDPSLVKLIRQRKRWRHL